MTFVFDGVILSSGVGVELTWALLLLPLPLLATWLTRWSDREVQTAIRASHFRQFSQSTNQRFTHIHNAQSAWTKTALWLAWVLFLVTLSRPFVLGEPVQRPEPTRDILLAVDLSESMADEDMAFNSSLVSRLQAAKIVLSDFIEKREGDRLGLIYFADTAYLASSLTSDRRTLNYILQQASVGLIGDSTSITDTVGLAIRLFNQYEGDMPALILLTDGDNTSGNLSKSEAVRLAASGNLQIFAIVMGPNQDETSNTTDLSFLQALVNGSNGELFFANSTDSLAEVYSQLDERALNPSFTSTYSPKVFLSLYSFLMCCMCIAFIYATRFKWSFLRHAT